MKSVILAALLTASTVTLAAVSPMKLAEKSSYKLTALVKQGAADKSFLLDTFKLTIKANGPNTDVTLLSSSTVDADPNTLTLTFDSAAKFVTSKTHFTSANPNKVVFTKANADTILDLGSEQIVDHTRDSADIAFAADHAQEINFSSDVKQIYMNVLLDDGRTYAIVLDLDGNLVSKGIK